MYKLQVKIKFIIFVHINNLVIQYTVKMQQNFSAYNMCGNTAHSHFQFFNEKNKFSHLSCWYVKGKEKEKTVEVGLFTITL